MRDGARFWLLAIVVAGAGHLGAASIPLSIPGSDQRSQKELRLAFLPPPKTEAREEYSPPAMPPPARPPTPPPRPTRPPAPRPAAVTPPEVTPAESHEAEAAPASPSDSDELRLDEPPSRKPEDATAGANAPPLAGAGDVAGPRVVEEPHSQADLARYAAAVALAVSRQQRYPMAVRHMGLEGTSRVRVRLLATGELDGPARIETSSGHAVLDREAVRMVSAAAPFPAPPAGFENSAVEIPIPIRFTLR